MLNKFMRSLAILVITALLCHHAFAASAPEGTAWINSHGYSNCVLLYNTSARVILEPNCGGRVIEYSLNGKNSLYIDHEQDGWTYTPGGKRIGPCAGRFDIGPEKTAPSRPALWLGAWTAEIIGPRAARMTSVEDSSTGVQLIREFRLDRVSSRLSCTQTIINTSDSTRQYFHWSRTFATGGGICVVPLTPGSRFPDGYIVYEPKRSPKYMNFRPDDHPNIMVSEDFLMITGPPPFPKFGFDSCAGWLGYITQDNLLFVKKFPVYPERVYGEMAAITVSIWYVDDRCELEPIGPRETLEPGESASFTEDWRLFEYNFPEKDEKVNLEALQKLINEETR